MEEREFQHLMMMARTLGKHDPDRSDFYKGFQRGLRRNYHGENFGTPEEHKKWMNLDYTLRQFRDGYRLGFHWGSIRLTTETSASSYGVPMFVDEDGQAMDYHEGLKRLREMMGWSVQELANLCGVSARTVENWEQGRYTVPTASLRLIQKFLSATP